MSGFHCPSGKALVLFTWFKNLWRISSNSSLFIKLGPGGDASSVTVFTYELLKLQ